MDGRERIRTGLETGATIIRAGSLRLAMLLIAGVLAPLSARAAAINYGNSPIIPPGISFVNVQESSGTDPVPLFGPPSYFVTGMDFTPTSFVASATSGAADITDGQLNFTIVGTPQLGIVSLSVFESGDYTLVGTGTAATQVASGTIIRATVTEIDGVAVAPINLLPANASVGFNLVANAGVVIPWSLGLGYNVQAQLAPGFLVGATKVEVVIDNSLLAISEPSTIAFIAKKEFQVDVVVPEPAGFGLALVLGLAGLRVRPRRQMHNVN